MITRRSLSIVGVTATILLLTLPGCGPIEWIKDKLGTKKTYDMPSGTVEIEIPSGEKNSTSGEVDTSPIVVYIDGKPFITEQRLEKELKALLDANPQFQQMLALMDAGQLKKNLAEGLATQELINQFIVAQGIDKQAEYQAKLKEVHDSVRNALNTHFFSEQLPVTVTDAEITSFYDKNKDVMPEFLMSRGGVQAACVVFNDKDEADQLLNELKVTEGDLEKAALARGVKDRIKDLKLVTAQTADLDEVVRETILNFRSFPGSEMCQAQDGSYFVVNATSKEEPKYRPLASIQENLRKYLEKEKKQKVAEQKVDALKKERNVTFNESYFMPAEHTPSTGLKA